MTSQRNPITTVLFDLDGTIIDTNELIIQAFLYALKGIVPPAFSRDEIIPLMGQTLLSQMRQFSGREEVNELLASYREYSLHHHDEMVSLFPGVEQVVPLLKAHGLKLGVVTTKMRETTERALKLLGLYDYMDVIVTLDDVTHPKPHAEPVENALRALGEDPSGALMVGDSGVDILSALAAGAIPVGVAWSLKGDAVLREAGASHIIHDMRELIPLCGIEG
ncbi:pyrophosphatase PpaX [Cohnella nanjingensis]|uniref:Pyrophosphatase PpaX n=1 Tax=Cohnella nanjingensis TaxID=1387779 RepID=A0A7X0RT06_9BACL|nr:pyrophosphatase PpaX [Cohnella nanjingensis]MBB6673158.1 pyrophosphatase PpaX [Cohnella nanjingensis]